MYFSIIKLFSCAFLLPLSVATLIGFANQLSSSVVVEQTCSSNDHSDVCCIPFDIDINDGRGYGWFEAKRVAFSGIVDATTFTAVYRRGLNTICSGDVLAHEIGNRDWQIGVLGFGGAGSALVKKNFAPGVVETLWPDVIVVGGVEYIYLMKAALNIFWYRSTKGEIIYGRTFGYAGTSIFSAGQINTTAGDMADQKRRMS